MYVVAACLMRHVCEEEVGIMILACHQISKSFGDVSIIENGAVGTSAGYCVRDVMDKWFGS